KHRPTAGSAPEPRLASPRWEAAGGLASEEPLTNDRAETAGPTSHGRLCGPRSSSCVVAESRTFAFSSSYTFAGMGNGRRFRRRHVPKHQRPAGGPWPPPDASALTPAGQISILRQWVGGLS